MVIYNHKLKSGVKDMKKLICLLLVLFTLCGCVATETQPPAVDESLLLDANVMTQYIPRAVLLESSLEEPEFWYLYFVFMCNFDKDQPDFCYYSPTPVDENEYLHMDIETSKKIVWQVFGNEWDILENKLRELIQRGHLFDRELTLVKKLRSGDTLPVSIKVSEKELRVRPRRG